MRQNLNGFAGAANSAPLFGRIPDTIPTSSPPPPPDGVIEYRCPVAVGMSLGGIAAVAVLRLANANSKRGEPILLRRPL